MVLSDFDLILFGGTGDLAMRKLLPAMYGRERAQESAAGRAHRLRRAQSGPRCRIPGHGRARRQAVYRAGTAARGRLASLLRDGFATVALDATDPAALRRAGSGVAPRAGDSPRVLPGDAAGLFAEHLPQPGGQRPGDADTRAWCWKSRSGATWPARARSMPKSAACSPNRRSSASTITWARKRCRTCWRCASATCCSSRCGGANGSPTCRSRSPRSSASATAMGYYEHIRRPARHAAKPPAAIAVHRRDGAAGIDHAGRGARRKAEGAAFAEAASRRRRWRRTWCAASIAPATCDGVAVPGYRHEAGRQSAIPAPRPSSRSRRRSTPGAGPACRSTCAPASAWRIAGGDRDPLQADPAFDLCPAATAASSRIAW